MLAYMLMFRIISSQKYTTGALTTPQTRNASANHTGTACLYGKRSDPLSGSLGSKIGGCLWMLIYASFVA